MEYHLDQYRRMQFHCLDRNGVPIHVTKVEMKHMMEYHTPTCKETNGCECEDAGQTNKKFTIDASDCLQSSVERSALDKPGGIMKAQVLFRAYKVALTEKIHQYGVKIVSHNAVTRALRHEKKYNLVDAYDFAVKRIYTELKIVMDKQRVLTASLRDLSRHIRKLEHNIQDEKSAESINRKKLWLIEDRLKIEKKNHSLLLKECTDHSLEAKKILEVYLIRFENDLRAKGKVQINRDKLKQYLHIRKYDYDRALCLALSIM